MANGTKEDQDQGVYDAFKKTQEIKVKIKKDN